MFRSCGTPVSWEKKNNCCNVTHKKCILGQPIFKYFTHP